MQPVEMPPFAIPGFRIVATTVSDKLAQLLPLLHAHRDELEPGMEVSPHVEAYRALEQSGVLLALVAYADGPGESEPGEHEKPGEPEKPEIAGYSINFIGPHLHYSAMRYAHNDMLYVQPRHRGGKLGLALIRMTERLAAEQGARMMMWHAKPNTALEKLMPRLGYGIHETLYSKEIVQ